MKEQPKPRPYCFTRDTRLAACLCALNCEPYKAQPFQYREKGGKEWVVWQFETHSNGHDVLKLIQGWNEPDQWCEANPDHPFTFAMSAMLAKEYLMDGLRNSTPHVIIERSEGTWTVPKNGKHHRILMQEGKA